MENTHQSKKNQQMKLIATYITSKVLIFRQFKA